MMLWRNFMLSRTFKKLKFLSAVSILFITLLFFANVAMAQENPKVAFDETGPYGKYYLMYNIGSYGSSSFASLLEKNGFNVYQLNEAPLTSEKLKNYDVIILMAPGRNYTSDELKAIKSFVNDGGGLFLLGDGWGVEDGDENYAFNNVAKTFGVSFAYNSIVVDPNDNLGYMDYLKVQNISSNPLTRNINNFYFITGPYIRNLGPSTPLTFSSKDSWSDNVSLTGEGYSINNEIFDPGEQKGPLPVFSSMEYGKGKIVFFGSVSSLTNSFLYRTNTWKLGLNSVRWLSNQPVTSSYQPAGLLSPTVADFEFKIGAMLLLILIIIFGLLYKIRRDKKIAFSRPVKTIKNWKYNSILIINGIFIVLGIIVFFYSLFYYMMLDNSQIDNYDPFLGYIIIVMGVLFTFFSTLSTYNIFHRLRIAVIYSYFNIFILLFFAGLTVVMWDIFPFPDISNYTWESLGLLIPSILNVWVMHKYGLDLIIEGKEFNRLAKLSSKALPYELLSIFTNSSFIGEGGFGRVFKAINKEGTEVALKIPKTFDKKSETIFISEVSNWRLLDHPNIVKLFDFKILPIPYIEMEYCEESLEHGQKPLNEAISSIYEVAQGLSYAHKKKIIHGDIKTSNIMIKNGVHKISDWGLSKVKLGESITLSGATPQYAAPEQISHEFGKADERTDIYQLGTVFYELVTGSPPFTGETSQIYGSILNTQPINPSKINPESIKVEKIITKCLNKNKKNRYASMEELIKDLGVFYEPVLIDKTVTIENGDY